MKKPLPNFISRQWHARPLAAFSACFLLGMLAINDHPAPLTGLCAAAGVALLLRFLFRKRKIAVLFAICAAMLLGGLRMQVALNRYAPIEPQFSVSFEGVIVSDPVYNMDTQRIICKLRLREVDGKAQNGCVRLYLRSDVMALEGVEYGQTVSGTGHVWPQDRATNPYEFDSQRWLLSDGMIGMAAAKLEDVAFSEARWTPMRLCLDIRSAVSDRIDLLFPQNPDLVRAFVLGDRTGLTDDLRESFRQTGITHLICISGMHISVLASAISALLRRWLRRNAAVWTTIALVLLYGLLLGFPPSLVRATIMFALFSLAPLAGRPSDSITRLMAALLFMLAIRPFYLYNSGFVLSFWASAGIMLLETPLESLLRVDRLKARKLSPNRVKRAAQKALVYFAGLLCTTLSAQLATLPIVIAFFGAQSLLSLPVNLIAIPLAMAAYPLSLAALLLSVLWTPLGALFAMLPDTLFTLLTLFVRGFAALPVGELRAPQYPAGLFALHCALLIALSELSRLKIEIRRLLILPLTLLIGVSMLCCWIKTLGCEILFFDAGQADAALMRADGCVCLFDIGDPYSPISDYVSAACLRVDAAFLTHPHYDHAGALTELLENMPPKRIYVPEGWFDVEADDDVTDGIALAQEMQIPILELSAGDVVSLTDELTVYVHSPDGDEETVNDLSLLLEVQCRGRSVLFTGDLSSDAEPENVPDVDILKVAHHGSRYASSQRFLDAASPELAVISVGDNRYGHPSAETIERLHVVGAEVLRTDECGTIFVKIARDGEITLKTYLPREAVQ